MRSASCAISLLWVILTGGKAVQDHGVLTGTPTDEVHAPLHAVHRAGTEGRHGLPRQAAGLQKAPHRHGRGHPPDGVPQKDHVVDLRVLQLLGQGRTDVPVLLIQSGIHQLRIAVRVGLLSPDRKERAAAVQVVPVWEKQATRI